MQENIKMGRVVQQYEIEIIRACNDVVLNDPQHNLFASQPDLIKPCSQGKEYIDQEVRKGLSDIIEQNPEFNIFQCTFEFNGQKHEIKGRQTCLDYYNSNSLNIYLEASNLKITYLLKQKHIIDPKFRDNNSIEKHIIQNQDVFDDQPTQEQSSINNFKKFIKVKYTETNTTPYVSQNTYTLNEFADKYLVKNHICPDPTQNAKFVLSCQNAGNTFYGFRPCYEQINNVPLIGFNVFDRFSNSFNNAISAGLKKIFGVNNDEFNVNVLLFCSDQFYKNEDISNKYEEFLLGNGYDNKDGL